MGRLANVSTFIRRFMTRLPVLQKALKDFWMKVVCIQWLLVRKNAV